ncbi:MAG: hypothetical protein AB7F91_10495 [Parvularculaceae bacterium]
MRRFKAGAAPRGKIERRAIACVVIWRKRYDSRNGKRANGRALFSNAPKSPC